MSVLNASTPVTAAAGAGILSLHREGRLVECYPAVRGLLAEASAPELARAGQLLSLLDPDAVRAAHPDVVSVRIAVTGHGTLSALIPVLTGELARHGLLLRPTVMDFDSYVFDLSDPCSGLYAAEPDLVLCVLDPTIVFDELTAPWRPSDVEEILDRKVILLEQLMTRFEAHSRATLVLNTMPLLHRFTAQLVDHASRARLGAVWRESTARLLRAGEGHPGVVILDLDPHAAEEGRAHDPRLSTYTKTHLTPGLLGRYARDVGHLARNVVGRTKKCLVVDLDGTLWGGVLGDDGAEGIEVADSYRGEAFGAFQRVIKQLGSQGVLLAVASKNDLESVRGVLRDHQRMTLREGDFVQVAANWRPKHENLAELAAALNVGVDSLVFVDDSAFECGLVRRELPGVGVVRLGAEAALHPERLLADGWFDTRELTEEDRTRATMYREDLSRKSFLSSFDSLGDYLRELGVTVRLGPAEPREVPRVSQLTLRTNQFNLTTLRLGPAEVRELLDDPAASVLTVHAGDRFGDNGLVGAVFLRRAGAELHIENFVLSCRVFSRGIEDTCLAATLRHARATGAESVVGTYRTSAKNGKVRDLYPRFGFAAAGGDGTTLVFRHGLAEIPPTPEHVRLTDNLTRSTP
jgi:FkbH-like protein